MDEKLNKKIVKANDLKEGQILISLQGPEIISFCFNSWIYTSFICPSSNLEIFVSSLKQAVATGAAMHKEATQSKHNGLIGMMYTAAQAGHTATAAPDCVIGMRIRNRNCSLVTVNALPDSSVIWV